MNKKSFNKPGQYLIKFTVYLCGSMLLLWIFISNFANAQPCDPHIKPVVNSKTKYSQRQNRCEGFYTSRDTGKSIDVVGLIYGEFTYKPDKNEVLTISAPFVNDRPVHASAVGIPERLYYRMDTIIKPGQYLIWPMETIIYPQKLTSNKIGVFGRMGKGDAKIYVPIKAVPKLERKSANKKIYLYLRATVDVENVKWRSAPWTAKSCASYSEWNNAPKKEYRAGKAIQIILPSEPHRLLCIEVAGKEKGTARWLKRQVRVLVKE